MGGNGAESGFKDDGTPYGRDYGTEFRSLLEVDNIKFVKYNDSSATKAPLETRTKGRIYATIDANNDVKHITFYDNMGKRKSQIDLKGKTHYINGKKVLPHIHIGYKHDEKGTRQLTKSEQETVDKILKIWDNHKDGK